jgi:hypothetical protein
VASWSADISRLKKATLAPPPWLLRSRLRVSRIQRLRRVERNVGGKRGLAHTGTSGVNLLRKVARTDQTRTIGGQFDQIARSAQFLHRLIGFEKGLQRHRRDQHIPVDQTQYLLVNPAVQRFEEMVRLQLNRHIFDDAVIDQDRAQKSSLRFDVAGQALGFSFVNSSKSNRFGHDALSFSMNGCASPAKNRIGDRAVDNHLPSYSPVPKRIHLPQNYLKLTQQHERRAHHQSRVGRSHDPPA